jgi:hypothetical protein
MRQPIKCLVFASLLAGALSLAAPAQEPSQTKTSDEGRKVVWRGRVVCLTEELGQPHQAAPDGEPGGHLYSLKTAEGKLYSFLPTDTAAAIYDDPRFRERELQVTAQLFPQTSSLEVIKLQSVRAGKVYDLYYFCEVCNIVTHKPGPCMCCRDPVEFRETLAEEGHEP